MTCPRPLVTSLVMLLPCPLLPAQAGPPAVTVSGSCGLQVEDRTLWGVGRDYKARFLDDGVEFTPALGARAPRNLPVRFRLLGVGRRGSEPEKNAPVAFSSAGATARTVAGQRVHYRHGDVTERYEVRPDGIEQSFVFDALPSGDGDLVVRGTLATELLAMPGADGTLELESPGLGGVRIGAVTGIDAAGRRAAGALAFSNGVLELSLPAAFVAQAALPLVLDPLIGTTIAVGGGFDEKEPDAAFIPSSNRYDYLVVWSRVFSSGDADIRGQRLNYDGSLLGGLIAIRTSTTLSSDMPRVAPVKLRDRHVVVWREIAGTSPGTIAACSVDAITGAVSTATQVVAGTDAFVAPDVGGDAASLGDTAIVVWGNVTQSQIEGARITVAAAGTVTSSGRRILSSSGNTNTVPSIAQDCGRPGLSLIAWTTSTPFSTSINGLVVDRFLTVRDQPVITTASTVRTFAPDVSGDGLHWVVGYDRRVNLSTPPDVYVRWVTFDPVADAAYVGPEAMVGTTSGTDTGAATTLLQGSVLAAYRTLDASSHGAAFVRSLDQFSCGPCEGFFILESNGTSDVRRIASTGQWLDALLVWESVDPATGIGQIRGRRFDEEVGGIFAAPACGSDLVVYATCARPGNTGFNLRLEHAEPGQPAFVILREGRDFPVPDIYCGSTCGFLDPFRGWFLVAGVTDVHGNAALHLPIPGGTPPDSGIKFQFGFVPAGTAGCPALGLSFSRIATMAVR